MKKADSNMWWIIIGAVIVIIAAFLILVFFNRSGEKLFGNIDKNIEGLSDKDEDLVADIYDKCPCDSRYGDNLPDGEVCGTSDCREEENG